MVYPMLLLVATTGLRRTSPSSWRISNPALGCSMRSSTLNARSAGISHALELLGTDRQIPALQQSDLPPNIKGAVRELASLRNAAAHGAGDVTLESALDYIVTAQYVARPIALGDYDRA